MWLCGQLNSCTVSVQSCAVFTYIVCIDGLGLASRGILVDRAALCDRTGSPKRSAA